MERTTFKDLAVYYEYQPGQKGTFDQPEFAPQIDIFHIAHLTQDGSEYDFEHETEYALLEKLGDRIEKEILG